MKTRWQLAIDPAEQTAPGTYDFACARALAFVGSPWGRRVTTAETHESVGFSDAYCGWCYGFGPALHEFAAANADRIEVRVLSGGLFTGSRALPVSAYPHIPGANERIAQLTGVTFGDGYGAALADGTAVMDSADAATGLVALRSQPGVNALDAAAAMQRAWYVDGRSLSDAEVYRDIAAELGLDADAVAAAYVSPAARAEAEADFLKVRRLGVDGYPTLLLHTAHGTDRLGGPVSSADALTRALDQHLAAATAA